MLWRNIVLRAIHAIHHLVHDVQEPLLHVSNVREFYLDLPDMILNNLLDVKKILEIRITLEHSRGLLLDLYSRLLVATNVPADHVGRGHLSVCWRLLVPVC